MKSLFYFGLVGASAASLQFCVVQAAAAAAALRQGETKQRAELRTPHLRVRMGSSAAGGMQ